ncbi:MAG TPA: response regulator transcription factor [Clostridiaceae bacterium]|nr:response regulator transcription factor [Clostridiaceae bacterium]
MKKESYQYLIDPLTERETEVLNLIAEGMSNKEIADCLNITVNTVKGYIKNIYEKLGVSRRVQVVARAREMKILGEK